MPLAYTVQIPFGVTRRLLDDILIAAFEGGINYWCWTVALVAQSGVPADEEDGEIHYAVPGFRWELATEDGRFTLDEKGLVRGLQDYVTSTACEVQPGELPDFENLDAADADQILQHAIFGELVYA